MKAKNSKAADVQEEAGWEYKPSDDAAADLAQAPEPADADSSDRREGAVEWSASEFVDHEKGIGWYLLLGLATIAIAAGVYLTTREVFSTAIVVIMAAIFGIAGAHKPQVVSYRLDRRGLTAGKKFYPYANYKSFVMPDDGPFVSVMLLPMKRFDLPTGAYLAPENQQEILELLSSHLPLERGEPGLFDTVMRRLRF